MKILLTGGKGFLGKFIEEALVGEVMSLGRNSQNQLVYDLSENIPVLPEVEMVVHNAGKAHVVPKTKAEENGFYKVNVQGTKNLLIGLDRCKTLPKSFVFISTVAVYGQDSGFLINEQSKLKGATPYAKSKIEAEKLLINWGEDRGVHVVILRLPLVVGLPNPPGNLGAMLRGIRKGRYARVGDGQYRKSMVLAADVAALIPKLINQKGTYNLTDRIHPTLADLDEVIANAYGKKIIMLPFKLLAALAKIGDFIPMSPLNSYRLNKLTASLTFDDQLAFEKIGWSPQPVLQYLKNNLRN
ncbi:NAD-dependent epimerase/dehydratase family protein [Algoriphagus sp.]|uniref:NAD-dependent epimerase/dehydratase family protein n=1 Tax=Algoriphagus sp. TaxID=1872435 RepID=UPI003F6F6EBE